MMAKRQRRSPQKASPANGIKQQKHTKGGLAGAVARPEASKAANGQADRGARRGVGRPRKAAAVNHQQNLQEGQGRANSSSSVSQDVSIDAQPSYASAGGIQLDTGQAQTQPSPQPDLASAQFQQPAIQTLNQVPHSKGTLFPADGQPAELKVAVQNGDSLLGGLTAPGVGGTAASSEALQAACAGPQLQPVLKHASRVGQLARADTAMKPVACFSASDAVQSERVPGNNAERCRTNSAAAAAATKQSSDAQQHPANAYLCPAKATKPRKAAATTAKRQQQQQQALLSAASVHFDCQQLKLLPGDVPLHSECMARMQRNSAEPSQTSRYIQRARLTDEMAQAGGEDSAVTGATLAGCVPARPYALLAGAEAHDAVSPEEAAEVQQAQEEYDKFDFCLRKVLWLRALNEGGQALADAALADRDTFVQVCLLGQRPGCQAGLSEPPSVQQATQACRQYHNMLQRVYGPNLILGPHIMDVNALKDYNTSDDLHQFRLLQRRFIVYRSSKAGNARWHASTGESPHPSMRSAHSQLTADSSQAGDAVAATAADSAAVEESACDTKAAVGAGAARAARAASPSSVYIDIVGRQETSPDTAMSDELPDWDNTLLELWQDLQRKTAELTCKEVQDNSEVATAPSCTITEGSWRSGHCHGHNLADSDRVWAAIDDSLQNKAGSSQRLYFLDGTFPGDLPEGCSIHEDVPGLCCGVDQAVNRMLPEAIRSSRPTNFFKQLCVESTGTASFTMFAPIGQLTNVTAFHQETKKRRSWNCGSGDFIVQPVASASNVRKLERVHAAVMGAHRRSHCLLPLEMYLEEGIPLVCYVRDGPHAEMVELPEQSCHAFLSFSNVAAKPPSLKVSCNDWHLVSELSSAYLLEKLVYSMQEAQVEAGPPQDEADSWVASPYAALQPCTIEGEDDARLKGTWQRPWADETEDQECSPQDIRSQADPANRSSRMEVLLVRSVEKALDAVNGHLKPTAWNAVLSKDDGLRVLQDALPVVLDLQLRAIEQPVSRSRRSLKVPGIGDDRGAHFSREYMTQVVREVQQALSSAAMNGAGRQAEGLLLSSTGTAQPALPEVSAGDTSSSVDILASTSSSTLETALAASSRKPRLSRRQQLQAQAGVQPTAAQPRSSSEASIQHSSAASQNSACASQRVSRQAADSQAQGGLQRLAAQVCQQNIGQSSDCRGTQGTKRVREVSDEAVHGQSPGKRLCRYSPEMMHVVRSDQVFSVVMHLQYAAKNKVEGQADKGQHTAKMQELTAAAAAVTDPELLQLGLPVLRSHWLLAMQQEWEASQTAATQFAQLGKARQRRCWLEKLHDVACTKLIETNAKAWGALCSN